MKKVLLVSRKIEKCPKYLVRICENDEVEVVEFNGKNYNRPSWCPKSYKSLSWLLKAIKKNDDKASFLWWPEQKHELPKSVITDLTFVLLNIEVTK